jgi:hypothetical protein
MSSSSSSCSSSSNQQSSKKRSSPSSDTIEETKFDPCPRTERLGSDEDEDDDEKSDVTEEEDIETTSEVTDDYEDDESGTEKDVETTDFDDSIYETDDYKSPTMPPMKRPFRVAVQVYSKDGRDMWYTPSKRFDLEDPKEIVKSVKTVLQSEKAQWKAYGKSRRDPKKQLEKLKAKFLGAPGAHIDFFVTNDYADQWSDHDRENAREFPPFKCEIRMVDGRLVSPEPGSCEWTKWMRNFDSKLGEIVEYFCDDYYRQILVVRVY